MGNQMNSFTPAWVRVGTATAVTKIPGRPPAGSRHHQSSLVGPHSSSGTALSACSLREVSQTTDGPAAKTRARRAH